MKKTILLLLLILPLLTVSAQDEAIVQDEAIEDPSNWEYCQIVGTGRLLSNRVTVEIDYGQHRRFFGPLHRMTDENDEVKKFNSMIDALNYMGSQGWHFVQAYAISSPTGNQNVYHYLLKRPVQETEE